MSTERLTPEQLADLAERAEQCDHCGGPMYDPSDEDEKAELAAMANLDRQADPDFAA